MSEFRIRQKGMTVAGATTENEILHYVNGFRQDGQLTVQVKHISPSGPYWKRHAYFAQYPQSTIVE